jgi:hypothetical protein
MAAEQLKKDIEHVVQRAKEYNWGITTLERRIRESTRPLMVEENDGEPEEPEEPATPVKHHKKEIIGPKERKKPTPWTQEEEAFFVNLVCDFGAQWSHFEQQYGNGELYGRNQTALKDKARNIMRKLIDNDQEEEWLKKFPLWAQVTVGQARRGVHAYQNGKIPQRSKRTHADMLDE